MNVNLRRHFGSTDRFSFSTIRKEIKMTSLIQPWVEFLRFRVSPRKSSDYHLEKYKIKGKDSEQIHRRRLHQLGKFRTKNREDLLRNLRNADSDIIYEINDMELYSLNQILREINSTVSDLQILGMQHLIKITPVGGTKLIDIIIDLGIISKLMMFLDQHENLDLRLEAASMLRNIATGTKNHVRALANAGCVSLLLNLLSSTKENIVEQVVWTLGSVASDDRQYNRCRVLVALAQMPLFVESCVHLPLLRAIGWTMSSMQEISAPECRDFLPTIVKLLTCPPEATLLRAVFESLASLRGTSNHGIDNVVQSGAIPQLIAMLDAEDVSVVTLSLRAITIISTDQKQIQALIDENVLPALGRLLEHQQIMLQRDSAYCLQLITKNGYIDAILNANLQEKLVNGLQKSNDESLHESLVDVVDNVMRNIDSDQITRFINQDQAVVLLNQSLASADSKKVSMATQVLESIIKNNKRISKEEIKFGDFH